MIERWIIEGDLTTRSPLWIRSGEVRQGDPRARRRDAEGKDGRSADVLACVLDDCKKPYLPGSALKGAVRAWLRTARADGLAVNRLFGGERNAGVALIFDAPLDVERSPDPPALMGSASDRSERKTVVDPGIAIDRITVRRPRAPSSGKRPCSPDRYSRFASSASARPRKTSRSCCKP